MSPDPSTPQPEDWDLLVRHAREFGANLQPEQVASLARYLELLCEWNQRFNLTAIKDPTEILSKHFLDSLACAQALDFTAARSLADVGTGAGFPGLVLKIAFPHLRLTLIDAVRKRLDFLARVAEELGMEQVTVVHSRAEDAAGVRPVGPVELVAAIGAPSRVPQLREQFDVVAARAVARLNVLAEWTLPLTRVGGSVLAMKGPDVDDEVAEATRALQLLGGDEPQVTRFILPMADVGRSLIVIPKVRSTPRTYPRPSGTARKSPL